MIGVTICSPEFSELARIAADKFTKHTGLASVVLLTQQGKNYIAKFELHTMFNGQTVVYFDADLWFINDCDLSGFDDQDRFLAVKDAGVYEDDHFPKHDCNVLDLDIDSYFNAGFFIWNDRHKEVFESAAQIYEARKNYLKDFGEQSCLNAAVQSMSKVGLISNSFNYIPFAEKHNMRAMEYLRNPLTIHAAGYGLENKMQALLGLEAKYKLKL